MKKNSSPVKSGFKSEISFTLIVKLLLLYGLWYFFFKNPLDKSINDRDISQVFLSQHQMPENPDQPQH